MDTTKTESFYCEIRGICSRRYPWFMPFSFNSSGNKGLLLMLAVLLLAGCKTVPIQDRNFAERGGLWEQDENIAARFYHKGSADYAVIGSMYASGESALLNDIPVKISSKVKNNSFVSTGPQSSARIEFKATDSTCSIRIDALNFGNAYADTTDCQQIIETQHAKILAKDAILHIHVSQQQTEVTVISGVIKVMLRENAAQTIEVRADREIIVTQNATGRSYPITSDEIWQRIRWRDDIQLYKTVVDWDTVIAAVVVGVVTVGIVAALVLLGKGHGNGVRAGGLPGHR